MTYRLPAFGKRRAGVRAAAAGIARRFSRRDDAGLAPLVDIDTEPVLEETVVSDVVAVAPEPRRYRATISRTVTQTAVVEFTADEGADTHAMAQDLLDSVAPEAWTTQPAESWGYIDKIEEIDDIADGADDYAELDDEPIVDPELLEPPAALARRARKMEIEDVEDAASVIAGELATLIAGPLETSEVAAARLAALDGLLARAEALAAPPDDAEGFEVDAEIAELIAAIEAEIASAESLTAPVAPEVLSRRRRVMARRDRRGARARRSRKKSAGAYGFLETLGSETVAAAAAEAFGGDGATAYFDALGDIVVVMASGSEYAVTEEDMTLLARSLGWSELDDEIPSENEDEENDDEDDLPPETMSRRRRAARARRGRARRMARKMAGADVMSEVDRIGSAVDEALSVDVDGVSILATLADLQQQAAALYVDPEDLDADTAEAALTDLRIYIDEQIAALTVETDPDPALLDAVA